MIIDIHVHLIALGPTSGCYCSPKLSSGLRYFFLSRVLDLHRVPREDLDRAYADRLVAHAEGSDLDAIGVLAFDAVYDAHGRYDRERTGLHITNDYCLEVCARSPKLLPVCSVNPQREDALEELERVARLGAVALKLLPNTHGVDPADPAYRPFWRRMAELGLPLLSHCSFEHTLPVIDQRFGRPERLRAPLEEGATVIAAHCAGGGVAHPFNRDIDTWLAMLDEFPNLYGDISAMASVSRFPYIHRVLANPTARERLLLGSDFPIPVSPIVFASRLGLATCRELGRIDNPLQRNLDTFRALGVDTPILHRAASILRLPTQSR